MVKMSDVDEGANIVEGEGDEDSNDVNLVTTTEAARILNKHRTTVTRMVARGVLVPVRGDVTAFLFRREDVEAKTS